MPYITPPDLPGDMICVRIFCPSGLGYEAALRGAVFTLTLDASWENVDGQTPEIVAQSFLEAWQETVKWRPCMPVGTVLMFAREDPPEGFLVCDGGGYDTGDYAVLFDVIGYEFGGAGDTFNVPDLQERFPYGAGSGAPLASSGGTKTHTLAGGEMPNHNHDYGGTLTGLHDIPIGLVPVALPNPIPAQTSAEGGGGAHNNMPPYITLLPVIAYR